MIVFKRPGIAGGKPSSTAPGLPAATAIAHRCGAPRARPRQTGGHLAHCRYKYPLVVEGNLKSYPTAHRTAWRST